MIKHEVFDKWKNSATGETAVQMFDYVAYFPNEEIADAYIESVKKHRKKHGKPCK